MCSFATAVVSTVLVPSPGIDTAFLCFNILLTLHLWCAGMYLTFERERCTSWLQNHRANLMGFLGFVCVIGIATAIPTDYLHLFAMTAFGYTWWCHYRLLSPLLS